MRVLSKSDFPISRYGISVRLVEEDDAEFILRLRTNEKLSRYLHKIDNDLEKQKQWIRDYKNRENDGKEYYFLFYNKTQNIGVSRLTDIQEGKGTGGSWICDPSCRFEDIIATSLLCGDIFFEILGIEKDVLNVSKGNNSVLRFHKLRGSTIIHEDDIQYTLELNKYDYLKNRGKIIKLLNL